MTSHNHDALRTVATLQKGLDFLKEGKLTEAACIFDSHLEKDPTDAACRANLATVFRDKGDISTALDSYREALQQVTQTTDRNWIYSNYLMTLNYSDSLDSEEVVREHCRWDEQFALGSNETTVAFRNQMNPDKRLHVGLVSGDFRWHSVSFFLLGMLNHLSKEEFEVTCFSDNRSDDGMTDLLRSAVDGWVDCREWNDPLLHKTILRSRVDVLIDLSGHTAFNRMQVFARRAAPVQVSWLGYPTPTGNRIIDYWLTDAVVSAAHSKQRPWIGSEPVLMSPGSHCYTPPVDGSEISVKAVTRMGSGIRLGCFNHRAKISETTLECWAGVLRALPTATLLLKGRSFGDLTVCDELLNAFSSNGIDPSRIELRGRSKTTKDHLSGYQEIDIALDTYPYNGTTTTCESLWMGVPVVTRMGESHTSRVTASLLKQLGKDAWIADNNEAYLAAVLELANQPAERKAFRESARTLMFQCGLTNPQVFAGKWGNTLRELWQVHVESVQE